MKRGNKEETPAEKSNEVLKPLWIKETRGTRIIRSPRYLRLKHKQKFRATPEELGRNIDEFTLLEGTINKAKFPQLDETLEAPKKEQFTIEHSGGGWYNVVSPVGEILNSKKLRSEEAEKLKASLEEDSE